MKDSEEANGSSLDCGCQNDHETSLLPQPVLVGISGCLTITGFLFQWFGAALWLETVALLGATMAGGLLIFPAGWKAIRSFKLDMNALMTVAVIGAWGIGEGAEAAVVAFLFALSELLESMSADRVRRSIESLLSLTPETAIRKLDDGEFEEVESSIVNIGEILIVRSGQRVPLDGIVIEGKSSVNQAPITGESVPVEKEPGQEVFAGTINCEGSFQMRVTKLASDSTLSRIIKQVEEAEQTRAPTQRFVDRFAAIYTPVVFVIAVLTALGPPILLGGDWFTWAYRALALLVVACPCALVIATPISIVSGMTTLVRRGILVKGGVYLEEVGKIRALAVDKTGTITEGKPQVIEVRSFSATSEDQVLSLAASIDAHSEHPIARAVVEEAKRRGIDFPRSFNYESITGRGAKAELNGRAAFVGNNRLVEEANLCVDEADKLLYEVESKGLSFALVGYFPSADTPGEVIGMVTIGDALRQNARGALEKLHKAGLQKIVMLSGDNQHTADAIALEAGLDDAFGDLLPSEKVAYVKALLEEYGSVAMIGDGVNDAPALATSSLGIAMGAMGSDTAIETADMALMNDDLSKLAGAIELGRRTLRIIRFNITFALLIKAIFLLLAVTGFATLWMAILADTGATLLVILNSMRLLVDEE